MKRRNAVRKIGEFMRVLPFASFFSGIAVGEYDYVLFTNYDLVFDKLTPVAQQVRLPLFDQFGNQYTVYANCWSLEMLNCNFLSGPHFYEYLHDDPLSGSPWTQHPERIAYKPLTTMYQTKQEINNGTFAYLPTDQQDGIFIISSPLDSPAQ